MVKTYSIATVVTVALCVAGYLGYVPDYIVLSVSICAFIVASFAFLSGKINEITESKKKDDENSLSSLHNDLNAIITALNNKTDEINKNVTALIVNQSEIIAKANNNIIVRLDESFKNLTSKVETEMSNISKEVSTFNTKADALVETLRNSSDNTTQQIDKLSGTLQQYQDKTQKSIADTLSSFSSVGKSLEDDIKKVSGEIDRFTTQVLSTGETFKSLSSDTTAAISAVAKNIDSVCQSNKTLIEELEDKIEDCLDDTSDAIRRATEDNMKLLSDNISELTRKTSDLSETLEKQMKYLELDVRELTESAKKVESQQTVQVQSDAKLLEKIASICR